MAPLHRPATIAQFPPDKIGWRSSGRRLPLLILWHGNVRSLGASSLAEGEAVSNGVGDSEGPTRAPSRAALYCGSAISTRRRGVMSVIAQIFALLAALYVKWYPVS